MGDSPQGEPVGGPPHHKSPRAAHTSKRGDPRALLVSKFLYMKPLSCIFFKNAPHTTSLLGSKVSFHKYRSSESLGEQKSPPNVQDVAPWCSPLSLVRSPNFLLLASNPPSKPTVLRTPFALGHQDPPGGLPRSSAAQVLTPSLPSDFEPVDLELLCASVSSSVKWQ